MKSTIKILHLFINVIKDKLITNVILIQEVQLALLFYTRIKIVVLDCLNN